LSSINHEILQTISQDVSSRSCGSYSEVNITKEGLDKVAAILRIKAFYISWHTVVYKRNEAETRKRILRKL
jgi:hypothetical protein